MTLLFLFTVSDILQNVLISLTTSLMCKYPNNVYTVSIKKGIQLMNNPLLFQIYVASVGRPLLSAFVLQWRIKYASVRVPLFLCLCSSIAAPSFFFYLIHRVTVFPLVYKNFPTCRNANMKSGTSGANWTKSWTLECFYSWRKSFSTFLFSIWVHRIYTYSR